MKNTPSLFLRFATLLLWLFMAVGLASAGLWWSMNPERGARWAQRVIDERFPDVARISPQELNARLRTPPHGGTPPLLIDVRTPEEQEVSTLRGARRVEPDATAGTVLEGVDAEQPVVLYCTGGFRAAEMAQRLMQAGHTNVSNLEGGIVGWANAGFPVEKDGVVVSKVHPYSLLFSRMVKQQQEGVAEAER